MPPAHLLTTALGLTAAWEVTGVRFDPEAGRMDLDVAFAKGSRFACPACGVQGQPVHDTRERRWQQLSFFHYTLYYTFVFGNCGVLRWSSSIVSEPQTSTTRCLSRNGPSCRGFDELRHVRPLGRALSNGSCRVGLIEPRSYAARAGEALPRSSSLRQRQWLLRSGSLLEQTVLRGADFARLTTGRWSCGVRPARTSHS